MYVQRYDKLRAKLSYLNLWKITFLVKLILMGFKKTETFLNWASKLDNLRANGRLPVKHSFTAPLVYPMFDQIHGHFTKTVKWLFVGFSRTSIHSTSALKIPAHSWNSLFRFLAPATRDSWHLRYFVTKSRMEETSGPRCDEIIVQRGLFVYKKRYWCREIAKTAFGFRDKKSKVTLLALTIS